MRGPGVILTLGLAGCAVPHLAPCDTTPAAVAWIVDYGWHTEIVLPAEQVTGRLAEFRAIFPGARSLSFGFGKQSFMTLPAPGSGDLIAGAIPGSATVRVIGLRALPGQIYTGPVTQLALTPAESTALSDFLWRSIAHTETGAPRVVAEGDDGATHFYAASRGYSLAYTCNAWAADALRQSGLPVSGTILFASGVMRSVARIEGACAPQG